MMHRQSGCSIQNLASFALLPKRLLVCQMHLRTGATCRSVSQSCLWIMTFSCWKWKHCGEMLLSAPVAGLGLRQPVRLACLARYGIPLPVSQLCLLLKYKSSGVTISTIGFILLKIEEIARMFPLLRVFDIDALMCLNLWFSSHIIITHVQRDTLVMELPGNRN